MGSYFYEFYSVLEKAAKDEDHEMSWEYPVRNKRDPFTLRACRGWTSMERRTLRPCHLEKHPEWAAPRQRPRKTMEDNSWEKRPGNRDDSGRGNAASRQAETADDAVAGWWRRSGGREPRGAVARGSDCCGRGDIVEGGWTEEWVGVEGGEGGTPTAGQGRGTRQARTSRRRGGGRRQANGGGDKGDGRCTRGGGTAADEAL